MSHMLGESKTANRWLGRQRARLWLELRSDKEYETWRLHRASGRLLYTLPPAAIVGVVMMLLHCWKRHISSAGSLTTSCILIAECVFSGCFGMSSAWSALPSLSKRSQLVLFTLQELLLMISALQIEVDSSRQLFYMSTVMPFLLIFSTIGYVPLGLFLGAVCPLHLSCWFLFHGTFSLELLALGLLHCFGALLVYLLVEEAELENFNVLSKLTFEQKYMETMHSSLQGMLSSIFDASCICNEEGDIRCWAQSPNRNDEALLSSLVNVTSLMDLTLDPNERESLTDFLQRMSTKAASCTDRVGTMTLKLKKAVPVEVQLTGIKVPARRSSNRRASKQVETHEESRMLIGLKLSQVTELRSNSKGRGSASESPVKSRRSSERPQTPQSVKAKSAEEPPVLRLPSKSRENRESRELRDTREAREASKPTLKHMDTDCLADDEGKQRIDPPRQGARPSGGLASRLQQRAKGKGLTLGMDCGKITRETTETFVDAHDHYEMLEQLGRGSVATVRKAIRKKDGVVVSLKISGSKDKSALVEAEFKILQSIKHPNIIRAFDYLETSVSSILVLEYFDGRSMEEAVRESSLQHFPELTARELFRSLLSAVCYLHSHRIIHRDVKPSNVMISADLSDLRLLDFNVAKRLTEGGALTVTGTRLYFAPEVINGEPPSEANDVWGCGICLFFMLAGRLPWKNLPETGVFAEHPELKFTGSWCQGLSEPCKSVIRQCLTVEMHWRPPVRTIMLHEWFWSYGFDPSSDADVNADLTLHRNSRTALRRTTL